MSYKLRSTGKINKNSAKKTIKQLGIQIQQSSKKLKPTPHKTIFDSIQTERKKQDIEIRCQYNRYSVMNNHHKRRRSLNHKQTFANFIKDIKVDWQKQLSNSMIIKRPNLMSQVKEYSFVEKTRKKQKKIFDERQSQSKQEVIMKKYNSQRLPSIKQVRQYYYDGKQLQPW